MILHKLFRTRRTGGGIILCYHGVARVSVDPWALFVTPEHFAEQMQVLRERFAPTSLTSLESGLRAGVVPERAVVTTFDDGYANNLHVAYPILHEKDVPATVFVVSDYVGAPREFWWDELEQILLRPGRLPDRLSLTLGAGARSWILRRAASYTADELASDRWAVASDVRVPPDSRMGFYHAVWEALFTVAELERRNALDQLAAWAGAAPERRESHRPLTVEELVMLDRSKLVDIGWPQPNSPAARDEPP
jgi:peptidoglycan/xylan/chitin deacetylase (PgdA/CDA1 family)